MAATAVSILVLALDDVENLEPVELAALEPDIEDDERRPARLNLLERRVPVARDARVIALVLEDTGNQHPDVGFVVNDENVMNHGRQSS